MPTQHEIAQGESTISLSEATGHFADTIWNDPANAQLKQERKDMNVLLPGDVLTIPDKRLKEVSKPPEKKHRFRRKGIPAVFRMQVFDFETPRANQTYQLTVDGKVLKGSTDGAGVFEEFIPADAREGKLVIGPDDFEMLIAFGHLDPLDSIHGVQKRLNNLGYVCGEPNGILNDPTKKALRSFQCRLGLEMTGQPDDATLAKLEEIHDTSSKFPKPSTKT